MLLTTERADQKRSSHVSLAGRMAADQALSGTALLLASSRDRITTAPSIMMNMMTIMIAISISLLYAIDICMLIAMYNSLFIYVSMYEYNMHLCMLLVHSSVWGWRQWAENTDSGRFHLSAANSCRLVNERYIWDLLVGPKGKTR